MIYTSSKILVGLSSFVLLRLLTHTMVPDQYALYALTFAIVTFLTTVMNSFLTNSIIRFLPNALEGGTQRRFDFAASEIAVLVAILTTGTTAVILGALVIFGFVQISLPAWAAATIAAGAGSAFQIFCVHIYANRKRILYSVLLVAQVALFAVGAATIPLINADPVDLALLFLALSFILPLIALGMPLSLRRPRFSKATKDLARKFLQYGAPLIMLNVAVQLNTYLDQFMLRAMTDLHQVGLYAANYVVADKIIYALASVMAVTVGPLIFREWERGNAGESYQMIWRSMLLFVVLSMPAMVAMLWFPEQILALLIDAQYADGRVIIPYVMSAALFSGLASMAAYVHTLLMRTKELALIYISGTGMNFVLNLVFIPRLGLMGCAFSTCISFVLLFVLIVWRAHYHGGFLGHAKASAYSLLRRE